MKKGNRYLLSEVSYTSHKSIYEFVCLEVSESHYKVHNIINDAVFWIPKSYFSKETNGHSGYCVIEDLGEYLQQKTVVA